MDKKRDRKFEAKAAEPATSWSGVASWYDDLLEKNADSYQRLVILPNILRLAGDLGGKKVIDVGCGQGFFSREFNKLGAEVVGIDAAAGLVELARKRPAAGVSYLVASAEKLPLPISSADLVVMILCVQNIKNFQAAFSEAARVLNPGGRLFIVLNHPAFRIPKRSSWGFDEADGIQYRRLDAYLSESSVSIVMHPGKDPARRTFSFHRPLQAYFKALSKCGFTVNRLEEWTSPKKSRPGPRAGAENRARREFPLFLFLEARKQLPFV